MQQQFPPAIAKTILNFVPKQDHQKLLLICKDWSVSFCTALYTSPTFTHSDAFELFLGILNGNTFHPYAFIVQILDLTPIGDFIYMGDVDQCLQKCMNLKTFKLERCFHISNMLIQSIGKHCTFLEQVCFLFYFIKGQFSFFSWM
jgi:hypothetical protein